ncbi:MAG: solute carrier family 23 protein [Clostridia bacterium]
MEIRYGVKATPKEMGWGRTIICAIQQMLAIMAATLLVPMIVFWQTGLELDPSAALAGAGVGSIVYLLFTKRRSPVFLGSSFAFLGAMTGAATAGYGYFGLIVGAIFAGLIYVAIAVIIRFTHTKWVDKLMPAVIIGPTVALIGLSLSTTAGNWAMFNGTTGYNFISIICALVTFFIIVLSSAKGNKTMKLIPFVIGICGGYIVSLLFTVIGIVADVTYLQVLDLSSFSSAFSGNVFSWFISAPKFTIVEAFKQGWLLDWVAIGDIALLFMPIAFVVFAEHIADHKNLSTIINTDLTKDPGLTRTLLGDGIGSIAGAFVGACPNTTYGESIGCVAITGNASTWTIVVAAIGCVVLSFFTPFVAVVNSIPKCVMGGACIALYGFIAVSGLKMLKEVDLGNEKNLFVVSAILVVGIGGIMLDFGKVKVTSIATALIVGILTNLIVGGFANKKEVVEEQTTATTNQEK